MRRQNCYRTKPLHTADGPCLLPRTHAGQPRCAYEKDHSYGDDQFPFSYRTLNDPISGRGGGILQRAV